MYSIILNTLEYLLHYFLAAVTSVSMTHDGQCILVGCSDNSIKLIDKTTGEMLGE